MFELNCDKCGGDNLMDGPLCESCQRITGYRYQGCGGVLTPAGCPDDYDNEPAPIVAPLDCAACENTGYLTTGDFCECKAGQRRARQAEDGPTRWHDRHYTQEAKAAGGVLVIEKKEAA